MTRIFFKKNTLCFSVLGALIMVSIEVEPWALALSYLLLFFRFGAERNWWKCISPLWVNIFSVASFCLVLAQFRTFLGQEASSTLLVMLAALRITDFRSERDEKFLILLGFILVALKFLFSLDLYWFPIGGTIFLGLWRSLLPTDMKAPWKLTLKSAAKALPLVAILFFVFPRVKIPWAQKYGLRATSGGMGEEISPGDISKLTLSKETVFRAKFTKYRPGMRELYWRDGVLEKMSGFTWRKTDEKILEIPITKDEISYDYVITLEPSDQRFLPALEHTRIISSPMIDAVKTDRSVFKTTGPVFSRIQYSAISSLSWSGKSTSNPLQLTKLPPQTQAWADEVNRKNLDYTRKVQTLKSFFSDNGFAYTREPGVYKTLDDFLFTRKVGFCEHFAGSYATLARAIGIPARVVTGYQGGEWNETGDFLRVTQADAHAWAEIRHPNGNWHRVDPTFWVAPLRIDLGGLNYFQLSPNDLKFDIRFALDRLRNRDGYFSQVINTLQYQIDNLNFIWTRTLLEFNLGEQQRLLKILAPKIGWWIAGFVFLFLMFAIAKRLFHFHFKYQTADQAIETFFWLQKQYEKLGFHRQINEAPLVFLEKVKQQRPHDSLLLQKTIQLFQYERYRERKSGPDDWNRLKRAWKKNFKDLRPTDSVK